MSRPKTGVNQESFTPVYTYKIRKEAVIFGLKEIRNVMTISLCIMQLLPFR